MRGERAFCACCGTGVYGSSPHARGTQVGKVAHDHIARFIPACAGNAAGRESRACPRTVHPRMRGERPPPRIDPLLDHGSSPHARGTRLRVLHGLDVLRFIPACAGNAREACRTMGAAAVHPRMRGERIRRGRSGKLHVGSSPHARGTRLNRVIDVFITRFIPACAGNAWLRSMRCRPSSVHPRMRGERQFWADSGRRRYGSSPHARGTPHGIRWFENPIRFIPACAGNAERSSGLCGQQTVHPRMRGERAPALAEPARRVGSSPHARGTLRGVLYRLTGRRFIPACAGNAQRASFLELQKPVHPRMRGERSGLGSRTPAGSGSSPHARGTQLFARQDVRMLRFIPACAGNADNALAKA